MSSLQAGTFEKADEVRSMDKTTVDVIKFGGATVGRLTMEPGWSWSACVKPTAGTDSCQNHHVGVVVSGQLHVVHDDGTTMDLAQGDVYEITPGHDGWVVGDEAFVGLEFASAETYGKS